MAVFVQYRIIFLTRDYCYIILLLLPLLAGLAVPAAAQQKIGYINSDKILAKMPQYAGVQKRLSALANRWRAKLGQMKQHIDSLKKQFGAKKLLYSDKRKALEKKDIRQLVEQRKQYLQEKFGPKGAYFKKQQVLLKPIQRKLYEAVRAVAAEKNIDFVFDRAKNTSLLFARKEWNLNKDVLQALNISLDK